MSADYEPTRPQDERIVKGCELSVTHYRFGGRAYFVRAFNRPHLGKVIYVCEQPGTGIQFTIDELQATFVRPPKEK